MKTTNTLNNVVKMQLKCSLTITFKLRPGAFLKVPAVTFTNLILLKYHSHLQHELRFVIFRVLSGHRHATISLICMSTHKATAARCLSDHQAAYGQPAIRALATAPLRRLALSVLFTIATNSYQTTCTVSERTFNKRQHANARQGVDFTTFTHYNMVAART